MTTLMASLLAWALAFAGMAALALAMERHHGALDCRLDLTPWCCRMVRAGGVLLLATAAGPCVQAWGGQVGMVAWLGHLSAGALLTVAGLAVMPRVVAAAAPAATLAALCAWFWAA